MRAKRDALVGLMVVAAAWAGSASAAPTKAQVCEAAKTTAAGKLEKCLADQRAREVKGPELRLRQVRHRLHEGVHGRGDQGGTGSLPDGR